MYFARIWYHAICMYVNGIVLFENSLSFSEATTLISLFPLVYHKQKMKSPVKSLPP